MANNSRAERKQVILMHMAVNHAVLDAHSADSHVRCYISGPTAPKLLGRLSVGALCITTPIAVALNAGPQSLATLAALEMLPTGTSTYSNV